MKSAVLFSLFICGASLSTELSAHKYAKRISQGNFRNPHQHPHHSASLFFNQARYERDLQDARNAQGSPVSPSSSPVTVPGLSPRKPVAR
jgi:hypothetical protein